MRHDSNQIEFRLFLDKRYYQIDFIFERVNAILLTIIALSSFLAGFAMQFKAPGQAERLKAIGETVGLSRTFQRALEPGPDFKPISTPKPGDWLAGHPETGQTYVDFVSSNWNRPDKILHKIYLQPLGEFPSAASPSLEALQAYAEAFFCQNVEVLPALQLDEANLTTRINPYTGNRQILTRDVLGFLQKLLPNDGFCILAITMEDLYPGPAWNFVFGQASLRERVGIYSFARYDPTFYGEERREDYQRLLLKRSCKVLVHETAHMFGLQHCIYYKCVLNGSNHLKESDSRPLHLCPVCLRKLQFSIGFDVVERYQKITNFCQKVGFDDEARWLDKRLKWILGD